MRDGRVSMYERVERSRIMIKVHSIVSAWAIQSANDLDSPSAWFMSEKKRDSVK